MVIFFFVIFICRTMVHLAAAEDADFICPVDILPDDVLLIIFSFVTLIDRAAIARVCTRWNVLIRTGCLWKSINLTLRQKFPPNSNTVLCFLETYATNSLQTLILPHVDDDILRYLKRNCMRLTTLRADVTEDVDLVGLPTSLKELHLAWPSHIHNIREELQEVNANEPVLCIKWGPYTPMTNLQSLTVTHMVFSPELFQQLSSCSTLKHLHIDNCCGLAEDGIEAVTRSLSHLKTFWLDMCSYGVQNLNGILHQIVRNLTKISDLRITFVPINTSSEQEEQTPANLFFNQLMNCRHLNRLHLQGITGLSAQNISRFLQECRQINSLSLKWCGSIADDVLATIFKNGTNLHTIELLPCSKISDGGMESMSHHLVVQNVKLNYCQNVTLPQVLKTVVTLPKVKQVEVGIYQQPLKASREEFDAVKKLKPSLTVDVQKFSVCIAKK
ncbi:uncharacterized protein [Amphiura filiformis]|uniref:uncharacterized protein n=1 Tax=Amphiura filiformis TaxID=82378 RepID=UPI003B213977